MENQITYLLYAGPKKGLHCTDQIKMKVVICSNKYICILSTFSSSITIYRNIKKKQYNDLHSKNAFHLYNVLLQVLELSF